VRAERFVVVAIALAAAPIAWAHHSGSIFNPDSVVAVQGEVSRFNWTNPHVYIYVETTDRSGDVVEWEIETDATPILTRSGWSSQTLKPGDRVVVRANPDRNPQRAHGRLISVTTGSGAMLTPRSSFATRASESDTIAIAPDFSGV